jgi:hypothetical protein
MYRKISQDSVNAFLNKELFSRENMRVVSGNGEWYLLLHGNIIAKMFSDSTIIISTCGWHTRTTIERLNCLLYTLGSESRLRIRKGKALWETSGRLLPWDDNLIVRSLLGKIII